MAKKQPFKKQRHKVGKYLFVFSEADDQAYLYAFKENIPCFFILFADIFDEQKHLTAHYERVWEKKTNTAHVENFIKKFLQDAEYREQFRTAGEKVTECLVETVPNMIDPRTERAIRRINMAPPHTLSFKDFSALKTYGRDKVSNMKLEELKDIVSDAEMLEIEDQVPRDKVVCVLRWVKRGLKCEFAIRKIKTDVTIANNAFH